jgi:hypothetical protein
MIATLPADFYRPTMRDSEALDPSSAHGSNILWPKQARKLHC